MPDTRPSLKWLISSIALAIKFRNRPSSVLTRLAFDQWRHHFAMQCNLQLQAIRYDEDILVHRFLLVWRVQLRIKLKMAKHAKVARKYLLLKNAWQKWKEMTEVRKRESKVQVLNTKLTKRFYESKPRICHSVLDALTLCFIWFGQAGTPKLCERKTTDRHFSNSRIILQLWVLTSFDLSKAQFSFPFVQCLLRKTLGLWTDRVIAIKLRELEVAEKHGLSNLKYVNANL